MHVFLLFFLSGQVLSFPPDSDSVCCHHSFQYRYKALAQFRQGILHFRRNLLVKSDIPKDQALPFSADHRLQPVHGYTACGQIIFSKLILSHFMLTSFFKCSEQIPKGTPSWPFGRLIRYTQGHPIMAIRPSHKVYPRYTQGYPIMAIRLFHNV